MFLPVYLPVCLKHIVPSRTQCQGRKLGVEAVVRTMTMTMELHLSQPVRLIRRLNLTQVQHAFWPINSTSNI